MSFLSYINGRIGTLFLNIIVFILISAMMYLSNFGAQFIFVIGVIWFCPLIIYMITEYLKISSFYKELVDTTEKLDKKYLVAEVLKEPNFYEGKLIYDAIRDSGKSMNEYVRDYKIQKDDYRDYIETWVHEIKTPIASSKLIIENNKDETTTRISDELDKVDGFIEQVLYYSRSTDVSRDYIIRETELNSVIRSIIRANSKSFITKRIAVDIDNEKQKVFIDEKWILFILNQIIQNSIKYSKKENAKVKISIEKLDNSVKLSIKDNGVGISSTDISRVFDKGFTGQNGRAFAKSTGMGLYICKKLCDGLGINLSIESEKDEFTNVTLIIPIGGASYI
ncbi:MAG: ATP-binding protein [Sarcina sp.]